MDMDKILDKLENGSDWLDTITWHLPSKTPKGKKDALKATAPQSKHYKQKAKMPNGYPK